LHGKERNCNGVLVSGPVAICFKKLVLNHIFSLNKYEGH